MQHRGARSRPPLDWDDARVFLAVLRATSLVGAARSLHVDKSTLSRRIDRLETSLGARLFVRTHEGIRPSSAGEALRGPAEDVERAMLSLTAAAAAGGEGVTGRVRIATTEGMAARLVQGGLLDLSVAHPGLELEVLGGNRPVDLARGEADLAVRVSPTKDPSLVVRVLGKHPIVLFASPRYLRARGVPRSLAQLEGHDLLLHSADLAELPEAKLLARQRGARVAFRSSSLPALVEAAVRDHGLVALARPWGEATPGLEASFDLDVPLRATWLVMHPDVAKRTAVRVVAERLAEAFRGIR